MSHRKIRIVDVFTSKPLAGNQLAVILDGRGISSGDMQRIAREMNLAETTFVLPPENPAHAAKVRIFTPVMELPFAGHPTIGTAWVLANEGLVPGRGQEFTLEEGVGPVTVRRAKGDGLIWMTHPPLTFGQVFPYATVAAAIGVKESDILDDVPAQVASTGNPFLFVALQDAAAADRATPDPSRVRKLLKGTQAHGVFLFAVVAPERLYSRMFAVDVPEDPATGSAAGPLGAFAVKYELVKRAPTVDIESEQGTKMGRQAFVHIRLTYGASKDIPEQIEVGGSVRPVLSGTLADFA
ncbi:MAG TPA: PhzF family phenazine biosynthesis protein [Candidatus Dormibacteraeota bacterium]|nr:PhzF family phenazine biosynthesis protein [Candidatus Dormibacteraeota bacterium]